MSFLKKLFGGGSSKEPGPTGPKRQLDYNGFMIAATPYKEGGQWQTCGTVTKTINGEVKLHRFVRADRFSDEESAADHAIMKGQQIIDQLGERVFS
ncbi:MAG: HlyU family transcriptional regulator [Alphaproteobacteria bacterium]|uniref:HlyU family transcriptional regulator n=1 Tax=Aestuariivirga sp. TaxID=2650926 RepID=UPI00301B28AD|nr:HlyU family transcriptional regulator [Alphaproteobacteria bacterium]